MKIVAYQYTTWSFQSKRHSLNLKKLTVGPPNGYTSPLINPAKFFFFVSSKKEIKLTLSHLLSHTTNTHNHNHKHRQQSHFKSLTFHGGRWTIKLWSDIDGHDDRWDLRVLGTPILWLHQGWVGGWGLCRRALVRNGSCLCSISYVLPLSLFPI